MAASDKPTDIQFERTNPPGAGQYQVLYKKHPIGKVGRFRIGAGQFGSTWVATTPSRKKSTRFSTREAAAKWLVQQARASALS